MNNILSPRSGSQLWHSGRSRPRPRPPPGSPGENILKYSIKIFQFSHQEEAPLDAYAQPSYGDLDTAASDAADPLAMLQVKIFEKKIFDENI